MDHFGEKEATTELDPGALSDIRDLRARLQRGEYRIDPLAVAQAFLDWHLQIWRGRTAGSQPL